MFYFSVLLNFEREFKHNTNPYPKVALFWSAFFLRLRYF